PVSRPLIRTSRRGRCLLVPAFLRNASAASRAAGLRSGTIESSRSIITAAAPLASALSSLGLASAGAKRKERMYRSLLGFLTYPKYRSGARFWRRNYRGLMGFELRGGTAYAYQKSHYAFGSSFRCQCHNRNGASSGSAADVCNHQGRRHRQCLHLPLSKSSSDVRRHARRRDCHRPDQLWPSTGGKSLSGRDPQDHPGADQVSDLQPSSL